jgi:hypothetical protein
MQKRYIILGSLAALLLLAGGVVVFLNGGLDTRPVKPLPLHVTGYSVPACTPAEVEAKVKAAPLIAQQQEINHQAAELARTYINGIVSDWKYQEKEKAEYEQKDQALLDQLGALQAQITELTGKIYCK